MSKLELVLLWHMHQPFYTDFWQDETSMPWVRLHATKAYNDMAAAIEANPTRVVFNFTPSLILQLKRLAAGHTDLYHQVVSKPVDSLTEEERALIIDKSFMVSADTHIKPFARYRELWRKRRSESWRPGEEVHYNYTNCELRDLTVCFLMAWMGWDARNRFPDLREILEKGWDYSEYDKEAVLSIGLEVSRNVLGRYARLARDGIIELTTSPYAHPILPLIIDSDTAARCMPWATLPKPFRYPEDARLQVKMAKELFREEFGMDPVGMWPSEGSVSPEIIPILAEEGFKYFLTDKGILQRSDGVDPSGHLHFHPYNVAHEGAEMVAFFRDTGLSDLIGFDYTKMPEKDGARDLLEKIKHIADTTAAWDQGATLTIVLDGENAWEYYSEGGKTFLADFYRGLAESTQVEPVLPREWIERKTPHQSVKKLYSGSWIRSDYSIWIGDEEENDAWETLLETRKAYGKMQDGTDEKKIEGVWDLVTGLPLYACRAMARLEMLAAEGSDWFWWFGDDFTSDNDTEFDRMFRTHLSNVYRFMGEAFPDDLVRPIMRPHPVKPDHEPVAFLHPTIDGKVTEFYEWNDGGLYVSRGMTGAMYTREVYIERIFYGYDANTWFLRLDRKEKAWHVLDEEEDRVAPCPDTVTIEAFVSENRNFRVTVPAHPGDDLSCRLHLPDREHPELLSPLARASAHKIMEISLPFKSLDLEPGDEVQFYVLLTRNEKELGRYPPAGYLRFETPDADFERKMWSV